MDNRWNAVFAEGIFVIPTEKNVHHYLTDKKTRLVCIINKWELIGQGEGSAYTETSLSNWMIANQDPKNLLVNKLGWLNNWSS